VKTASYPRGDLRDERPAPQDYLKAIHRLTEAGLGDAPRRAQTKAIATRMGVSPPSVSAMLDRLAAEGLVDYVHYGGVVLTERGRKAALRVVRRHRLLELYLTRFLGFGWDEVHDEAERLEHALSPRLESAIDRALGHPASDPHGDPIPGPDGAVAPAALKSLWSVEEGGEVVVGRVSDLDPALLRHLRKLGIIPGAHVTAVRRESGGALRLRSGKKHMTVGREAAEKVFVRG